VVQRYGLEVLIGHRDAEVIGLPYSTRPSFDGSRPPVGQLHGDLMSAFPDQELIVHSGRRNLQQAAHSPWPWQVSMVDVGLCWEPSRRTVFHHVGRALRRTFPGYDQCRSSRDRLAISGPLTRMSRGSLKLTREQSASQVKPCGSPDRTDSQAGTPGSARLGYRQSACPGKCGWPPPEPAVGVVHVALSADSLRQPPPRPALDPVFAHGISLREPAGPADVDFEEVE